MPTVDDVFGGTTLKSSDIKGKNPIVTINGMAVREFKDDKNNIKKKLYATFANASKGMVINKSNALRIAHLYGNDYQGWVGKKIKLQVDLVDFGGRLVDGIRVYPPSATTPPAPIAQPAESFESSFSADEVPF